jgi:cobalt-zinc-cadmium efflux system membrane fusion protein
VTTHARFVPLLAPLLLLGCRERPADPPPPQPDPQGAVTIPADSPQLRELAIATAAESSDPPRRCNGRLCWDEEVTARVFTPLPGRVLRIDADVRQQVHAEQALATITSPDFGQAQASARRAATDLQFAERTVARLHELQEHGAVALKEVQAADAELARARAEKDRTEGQLAAYGGSPDNIDQGFVIRAPIDGVVVERNLGPGQEVRPDQMLAGLPAVAAPLFVISDPSRLWIVIDATASDAARFAPGDPILVHGPSACGANHQGRVLVVADAVDPQTRMVRVRGEVDNSDRRLRAEMYVTADVQGEQVRSVQVPAGAVFLVGERHYLFVEQAPGRFERREVEPGCAADDRIGIRSGLAAGDRVVAAGSTLLEQLWQSHN